MNEHSVSILGFVKNPQFNILVNLARVSFPFQSVVLKDVSQQTVNDLITFIYHGDVKVTQENLQDFFKTAKSLKIKGLADAESLFSKTFGSATPHTASQLQTIQTVRVQSPEKVSSSENSQRAQPISNNNLQVEGHANVIAQIKTEKGEDDRQLVFNRVEADAGNKESNHNDKSVEQGQQQLAVKRERPSNSHANETAPKVKRAKQLNPNRNETANQFLERSFELFGLSVLKLKFQI